MSIVLPAGTFKADQLKLDASKPTILLCSDSPGIHTGQSQIVRNLFKRIYDSGKYNIVQFAWWHIDPKEFMPWPLLTVNARSDGSIEAADKYGDLSLNNLVSQLSPDLLWCLGDPWMLRPIMGRRTRITCPIIAYIPADGGPLYTTADYTPLSPGWAEVMQTFDCVVPLVPSAEKMFKSAFPEATINTSIPCGVDTNIYRPLPVEERNKIKTLVFTLKPSDKMIMSVGRNQQRKHISVNVAAMHFLITGHYSVCADCGKYTIWNRNFQMAQDIGPASSCKWCSSIRLEAGIPRTNLYYYMHTPLEELNEDSYRITPLLRQFNLLNSKDNLAAQRILTNKTIRSTHGMPESVMANYYNASDLYVSPSFGEGFGMPIIESLACGTPVIVPNCSAPPDFIEDAGIIVPIGYQWCEPQTTYWRGMVDLDGWVGAIDTALYKHPITVEKCTAVAKKYDWDTIVPQWLDLFDNMLKKGNSNKVWHQVLKGV